MLDQSPLLGERHGAGVWLLSAYWPSLSPCCQLMDLKFQRGASQGLEEKGKISTCGLLGDEVSLVAMDYQYVD